MCGPYQPQHFSASMARHTSSSYRILSRQLVVLVGLTQPDRHWARSTAAGHRPFNTCPAHHFIHARRMGSAGQKKKPGAPGFFVVLSALTSTVPQPSALADRSAFRDRNPPHPPFPPNPPHTSFRLFNRARLFLSWPTTVAGFKKLPS